MTSTSANSSLSNVSASGNSLPTNEECLETDVLIIGCGIAGATAALSLADAGIHVTIVSRDADATESNTRYAQGGVIYKGIKDSPQLLAQDILNAGAGRCNPQAVEVLVNRGPQLFDDILVKRLDINFNRHADHSLDLAREGGHSVERIAHKEDATGKVIEDTYIQALLQHPNITFLNSHCAIDLLTPEHHSNNRLTVYERQQCVGAYLFDSKNQVIRRCLAKVTIMATGGLGQIFLRSTNPAWAMGDGIAMAHRAGARVINLEYVQFHPTAFYQTGAPHFLITEAVRGDGARLVDERGRPFMERYAPQWKDLAPRDIIARSIHTEMEARNIDCVYLDLHHHITKTRILEHFPNIYKQCLDCGIDITQEPIPVVPAAHYSCGGIWADLQGRTTINNLYAIGEVACNGLHGANRLASTSLLEGLVWGKVTADDIIQSQLLKGQSQNALEIPSWFDTGDFIPDPALINQDLSSIKSIMWNYAGLIRNTHRLERALRELRHLEFEIERFYRRAKLNDHLISLRNAALTSYLVAQAAWQNRTSVGCHFRE